MSQKLDGTAPQPQGKRNKLLAVCVNDAEKARYEALWGGSNELSFNVRRILNAAAEQEEVRRAQVRSMIKSPRKWKG